MSNGRRARDILNGAVQGFLERKPIAATEAAQLHVVPHTHWDREWYRTFGSYRATLIELVDGLMDLLDERPDFTTFTFDGQVAPIDDYLATVPAAKRPAAEARLKKFIADGRIHVGPWYTLSDQFLVSGETTLRNLEMGIARANQLGKLMDIAYCPDQFGLIPELPKILRHVGISKVIGERGMARSMPETFLWEGSDGARVEALNIKAGYSQGNRSYRALRNIQAKNRGRATLFLAGSDHAVPSEQLVDDTLRAGATMSSLPVFWDAMERDANPLVYRGEIRAVGQHNLLPNVISNRVDQRLEVARAERLLERYAEPLAAFAYAADDYPSTLFEDAWRNQVWNAAHDSACASGIDEVTRQVRVRAREVFDTAEGIAVHAGKLLGKRMRQGGDYLWNPSNFVRDLHYTDAKTGKDLVARAVPPLGWSKAQAAPVTGPAAAPELPPIRFEDQVDLGDTYTFDPRGEVVDVTLPMAVEQRNGETFSRLHVAWENTEHNHRTRIVIKLPEQADVSVSDTPMGAISRPAVPTVKRGRDTLNGYPAGKFIVAGGVAILLDRIAEYELLPESNELAITLVRSHGWLSTPAPMTRNGGAGPTLPTHGTQMHSEIAWDLAIMPWTDTTELPWREYEEFMLDPIAFQATGGGSLAPVGTAFADVPSGVLSAVLPDKVRTFSTDATHTIAEQPLRLVDGFAPKTPGGPSDGLAA